MMQLCEVLLIRIPVPDGEGSTRMVEGTPENRPGPVQGPTGALRTRACVGISTR